MPSKEFIITGFGTISVSKRRQNRNIRLSVKANGKVLVTIPAWSTYRSAVAFAESKIDWLRAQTPQLTLLQDGQPVGKYHHLQLSPTHGLSAPRSMVTKTIIIIRYPNNLTATSPEIQTAASTACIRALRAQASQLLPQRLAQLAALHNFSYSEVKIKQLSGRWGSCDQQRRIVLNLFLMQLPWNCIDYVLLHELTHTQVLQHGPPFWDRMEILIPDLSSIRKQMRTFQPVLH